MPLTYKLDEEWCKKILANPKEISIDDLEWVKEACSNNGIVDREMPDS